MQHNYENNVLCKLAVTKLLKERKILPPFEWELMSEKQKNVTRAKILIEMIQINREAEKKHIKLNERSLCIFPKKK